MFVKVINNYIRFIVKSTDTNVSRAKMADYWIKFIEIFDKVSLFVPDVDYTESRLERYVTKQASGAVVAFIALNGFTAFRDLITGKSKLKINPKYKNILLNHGIDNITDLFESDWWNSNDCM